MLASQNASPIVAPISTICLQSYVLVITSVCGRVKPPVSKCDHLPTVTWAVCLCSADMEGGLVIKCAKHEQILYFCLQPFYLIFTLLVDIYVQRTFSQLNGGKL